jgi:hypothetical protein
MKKIIGFVFALLAVSLAHAVQPGPIPAGHNYINTGTKIQTTSSLVVYSSQTPGAFYLSTSTTGSPLSMSVDGTGIKLYDLNFANFTNGNTLTTGSDTVGSTTFVKDIAFSVGNDDPIWGKQLNSVIISANPNQYGQIQLRIPGAIIGEVPILADMTGTSGLSVERTSIGFDIQTVSYLSLSNALAHNSLMTFNQGTSTDPLGLYPTVGNEQDRDGWSFIDNSTEGVHNLHPEKRFLDFQVAQNHIVRMGAYGVFVGTAPSVSSISSSTLTVAGRIESLSGGFKFPDGSLQTTASSGVGGLIGTAGYLSDTCASDEIMGSVTIPGNTISLAGTAVRIKSLVKIKNTATVYMRTYLNGVYGSALMPCVRGSSDTVCETSFVLHAPATPGAVLEIDGYQLQTDGYSYPNYSVMKTNLFNASIDPTAPIVVTIVGSNGANFDDCNLYTLQVDH